MPSFIVKLNHICDEVDHHGNLTFAAQTCVSCSVDPVKKCKQANSCVIGSVGKKTELI